MTDTPNLDDYNAFTFASGPDGCKDALKAIAQGLSRHRERVREYYRATLGAVENRIEGYEGSEAFEALKSLGDMVEAIFGVHAMGSISGAHDAARMLEKNGHPDVAQQVRAAMVTAMSLYLPVATEVIGFLGAFTHRPDLADDVLARSLASLAELTGASPAELGLVEKGTVH